MAHQLSERFNEIEDKLKSAADQAAGRFKAVEQKVQEGWTEAKADVGQLRQTALERSRSAAKAADTLVRDHPWATAGLAACAGALIGWLIARD